MRDTFVQLESPAETMTKAFTPQGLLSAGLQDKQERSAKKQEELARETGASLINVPNKPPPPATGLLGAISAHERERKREGGMGAALTERERERRIAEDKQRKLDEYTRQQLEQHQQMAQAGSMYGMYGGGLSPQMTGFNPMMSSYFPQQMAPPFFNPMFGAMGFPSPQHMYAAQQAAQAYQQAMVAMSQAGSQIGGEGGNGGGMGEFGGGTPQPNPMMGSGGMNMNFDPRMSMVGMGSMGMPMGMGMGVPNVPMGSPLGMQMTGGSNPGIDPRFSMGPSQFGSPGDFNQRLSPFQGNSPREGSPARQGGEVSNEPSRRTNSASPAPKV
jgi:CCR4-NOT transcriptional complex subunit CAF120